MENTEFKTEGLEIEGLVQNEFGDWEVGDTTTIVTPKKEEQDEEAIPDLSDKETEEIEPSELDETDLSDDVEDFSDDNPYQIYAEELVKSGYLEIDQETLSSINTIEDLIEIDRKQASLELDNYKKQMEEAYASSLIEKLVEQGLIDRKDVKVPTGVKQEDLQDEGKAQKFLEDFYKMSGYKDRDIKRLIDASTDIVADAEERYPEYQQTLQAREQSIIEANRKAKEDAVKQEQELLSTIEKSVMETKEFIPGVPVSNNIKKEVASNVVNVFNKVMNDPAKYAAILGYLDKYKVLDGDFSAIVKTGESKATNKLASAIKNSRRKSGGTVSKDLDFNPEDLI